MATRGLLPFLSWAMMGLLAFLLPFTSFPLVARLTGSSMVAPLSLLPLGVMLLFWLLPFIARRGALPPQGKVFAAFVIAALVSSIFAFTLTIPAYKGHSVLNREIEALATLAIGLGFYVVISAWLTKADRLCFLLRWVNWGGVLMLAWAFVQGISWYTLRAYPAWMWNLQEQFTTSQTMFQLRANGFAYEPSWFAHQLNMLYLPYWLAATVSGFSAHRFKLWKIRFENILLLGGLLALILSVSRVGWLAFLLMASYLVLFFTWRLLQWIQKSLHHRFDRAGRWKTVVRHSIAAASLLVILAVYSGLLFGAANFISRLDPRMARLFDFSTLTQSSILSYANQLVFAERLVFWQIGWEIFNDYPIFGVGLGNAGFFFLEKMSDFGWGLTETRLLAYQWTNLPNIKSLWVRLLAETGIVGFAFFVSCWYVLWKSGHFLMAQNDRFSRTIGLTGVLVLVALIFEGFSVDTFALPYYWVSFGLLTAACEQVRRSFIVADREREPDSQGAAPL